MNINDPTPNLTETETKDEPVIPPSFVNNLSGDEKYLALLTKAIEVCIHYKPKFGQGSKDGLTVNQFVDMYSSDPFYHWIGLDSELVYAAHKAAGGMTSMYRQLGIGSQWIFNQVLQDTLSLTVEQANWSYQVPISQTKTKTLYLDGRIATKDVASADKKKLVSDWLNEACDRLLVPQNTKQSLNGVVFEARQGYKSKDSKRQNADIANAANAYSNLYLPSLFLFSLQIDSTVESRYREAQWLILKGTVSGDSISSGYVFCKEILGYDLAAFFQRNSPQIRKSIENVLEKILNP